MRTIFLSLLLVFFGMIIVAQQPPRPAPPPPPPEEEDAPPLPAGERENVRFFLAFKMKERLNLTEAQTLKVLDILKEGDDFRTGHKERMRNQRRAAYKLLDDPKASGQDYKKMADEMMKLVAEAESRMGEMDKKILALLTPRQQLEWLLFKKELQRGCGPGPGPGPGDGKGMHGKERGQPKH